MPDLEFVRGEIERMRVQVGKENLQLRRHDVPTASAETTLTKMLAKIEGMCAERDRLMASGRVLRRKGACLVAGVGEA